MQSSQNYKKLGDDILNLDGEILSVDVVDYNGDCLARSVRTEIKDILGLDKNLAKRWATWTILLVGLSKQFDNVLSEAEFLVIGRKNFKRLIIPLPPKDIVISLILSRTSEASGLNDKIRAFLTSTTDT